MSGPWEKYAAPAATSGPWQRYAAASAPTLAAGPTQKPAPPWINVVANAGPEAIAGVGDSVINFGPNLVRLGQMAYGTAASALGNPDAAPSIVPPRNYMREGLSEIGVINDLPNTEMNQNQRITNAMIQAATVGALSPASSMRSQLATAAKIGFTGGAAQTGTELTGNPMVGLGINMLVPDAGSRLGAVAQRRVNRAANRQVDNAVREDTLRQAQALGFKTTPGSTNPSAANVMMERVAGKSVIEGDISIHNQRMTDNVARSALSLPKSEPLTPETMKQIRKEEYAKGYVPVEQLGQIKTDPTFSTAIHDIRKQFTGASGSFPGAEPDVVGKLVATYDVPSFTAADAIKASAILREEASANFLKGETRLAKAQGAASKAIEDQIERHLQSSGKQDILDQFRASRRRMAISHTVENAIRVGSGNVEARMLARNVQGGKPLSPELETVAKFANTFPFVNRSRATIGTPGTNSVQLSASSRAIPGAIGGALGAHFGGWEGAGLGSIVGSQMPAITSGAATRYLMSQRGQRNAFANYNATIAKLLAQDSLSSSEKLLLRTLIANQQAVPAMNAYAQQRQD